MSCSAKSRIVLVSDFRLIRAGLRRIIEDIAGFEVIAEADFPSQARQADADCVLFGITAAGPSGLRTAAKLVQASKNVPVLVVCGNKTLAYVRSLLAVGIFGYVLYSATEEELVFALHTVQQGRHFIDPRLSDSVTEVLLGRRGPGISEPKNPLSRREMQALQAVSQGFTSCQIAHTFGLSTKTIETYRSRIYEKLGFETRADLVHYAIASGLLEREGPTEQEESRFAYPIEPH